MRRPAPDAYRLKRAKGLSRRRRGLSFPTKAILVVALAALGVAVFMTASGGVGKLVGALGSSMFGFVDKITSTPAPSATELIVAGAPLITPPSEPYTNQTSVDLQITVPSGEVGRTTARLRVYLTPEGGTRAQVALVPMGTTIRMVVPVTLEPGRNDFQATIVESGLESDASPVVTFILDTSPPEIVLKDPLDGGTVNADTATFTGQTQPRTALVVKNATNGTSISGQAGSEGLFALILPLEAGSNAISIMGTDPAGNVGTLSLTVIRGSGTLTASLTASAARISTASLPVPLQLNVRVLNPDGQPVVGASVTFTLTLPGIPPISKDGVTGEDGRSSFTTTLPKDVTVGAGLATVLVATADFGETSSQKAITIVP
ncbi:MAG: Ig-like domain-containing protein [Chloroflexota bacterium]